MLNTIIALILAGFWIFWPINVDSNTLTYPLSQAIMYISAAFLLSFVLLQVIAWAPLQKAEQNSTPRIIELWKNDPPLKRLRAWLLLFPLLSFGIILLDAFQINFLQRILYGVWIILLGFSLDAISATIKKTMNYLNPFHAALYLTQSAQKCIQQKDETELLSNIDALSEMGIKAINRNSSSLCKQSLDQLLEVTRTLLKSFKRTSSQTVGAQDKVRYFLYYLFQPLETINEIALRQKLEPITNQIVTMLGKISIAAADYDLSLAAHPLYQLGKISRTAQDNQQHEVALKGSILLSEVAKHIVTDCELYQAPLKDPILSILNQMHELAKNTFKQNKQINISLLSQPFKEMKQLFNSDRVTNHPDTPLIQGEIDRIIGEFDALEMVMRTIPPIPQVVEVENK